MYCIYCYSFRPLLNCLDQEDSLLIRLKLKKNKTPIHTPNVTFDKKIEKREFLANYIQAFVSELFERNTFLKVHQN